VEDNWEVEELKMEVKYRVEVWKVEVEHE